MQELLSGLFVFALTGAYIYLLGFFQQLNQYWLIPIPFMGWLFALDRLFRGRLFQFKKPDWSVFEWVLAVFILLFLIIRLWRVLSFNSFGDPLYYNLPVGRDYLQAGAIKWMPWEPFYPQAGFAEIWMIYLHALTPFSHLTQITSQGFYFIVGVILPALFLYKVFLPRWFNREACGLIAFSFLVIPPYRLESIVAKPDLSLMLLFILCLELWRRNVQQKNPINQNWIFFLVLLQISIKTTAALYLVPWVVVMIIAQPREWLTRFWPRSLFFVFSLGIAFLNPLKNWLLIQNPFYPLLLKYFPTDLLDANAGSLDQHFARQLSSWGDYLTNFGQIFTLVPLLLIWVLLTLLIFFTGWRPKKLLIEDRNFLLHLAVTIVGAFFIWRFNFSAEVFLRFLVGFVYLLILTPLIWIGASNLWKDVPRWKNWGLWLGFISVLGYTHSAVDFQQSRNAYISGSRESAWIQESGIAELTNFLKDKMDSEDILLPYLYQNRIHAPYRVYGSYKHSIWTSFIYTKSPKTALNGLAKLKPSFYALEKKKLNQPQQIMTSKEFLDKHLIFEAELRDYLVYRVPLTKNTSL